MSQSKTLFELPPDDALLWRYMDITKFLSLLNFQALFFARSDKLGDPFEGSFSKVNVSLRPHIYRFDAIPDAEEHFSNFYRIMRRFRQFVVVNCWHWNQYESAAMWNRYAKDNYGLALRTDCKSLSRCLAVNRNVKIGKVKYLDYSTTFIQESDPMAPFMCKRKSFAHEAEVRAVIRLGSLNNAARNPAPCDTGILQPVDVESLVKEIVVSPQSPDWFVELVQAIVAKYDFRIPVHRSSLDEDPVW